MRRQTMHIAFIFSCFHCLLYPYDCPAIFFQARQSPHNHLTPSRSFASFALWQMPHLCFSHRSMAVIGCTTVVFNQTNSVTLSQRSPRLPEIEMQSDETVSSRGCYLLLQLGECDRVKWHFSESISVQLPDQRHGTQP